MERGEKEDRVKRERGKSRKRSGTTVEEDR